MDYHKVIYGNYTRSNYPEKLIVHLLKVMGLEVCPQNNKYSLLELGCGDGTYVNLFNKYCLSSVGVDKEVDLEKDTLPYADNSFDFVFTKSTIEHVTNTGHFLSEAKRVLKPEGKILILTPSWEFNYRWFYDDPTHVKPFHRKGLQDILRLHDFTLVNVEYFYHLPFTWDNEYGKFLASCIRKLTPDFLRWKDKEEQDMNVLIRFSKEVQLLGVATK